jgi:hypothetical protein
VPENEHNLYRCNYEIPKRLIWTRDKNNYEFGLILIYKLINMSIYSRPFYETYFGGIVALTPEQYKQINGFSNFFWGWGGEDDDMSTRFVKQFYETVCIGCGHKKCILEFVKGQITSVLRVCPRRLEHSRIWMPAS